MSEPVSAAPAAAPGLGSPGAEWTIRRAGEADAPAIAAGVSRLLAELGGKQPPLEELETEVRVELDEPRAASLLVAEAEGQIVGLLTASWQHAIHVPGCYATIQDLWVDPAWRSRRIGADLIEALCAEARKQGVTRIEVGLPRETFAAIGATEGFYLRNSFESLGPRMRRLLS
jgi:GNAT superfamily N-acetyltransferase